MHVQNQASDVLMQCTSASLASYGCHVFNSLGTRDPGQNLSRVVVFALLLVDVHVQGQASDILIQAKEIERLRDLLVSLYVKHCGQETETVGETYTCCAASLGDSFMPAWHWSYGWCCYIVPGCTTQAGVLKRQAHSSQQS